MNDNDAMNLLRGGGVFVAGMLATMLNLPMDLLLDLSPTEFQRLVDGLEIITRLQNAARARQGAKP